MAVVFLLTIFALICQHVSKAGKAELKIQGGNLRYATVGSSITFTCVLSGDYWNDPAVRWFYNYQAVTTCDDQNLIDLIIGNDTYKACSLTINPVTEASGGPYLCKAYSVGLRDNQTVQLVITVDRQDATLHLLDPSTGAVLDDSESGSVCVQSGTTWLFKCRIQDARPGVWNFTWMLGNQTIATKSETRTGAGLVNVSSWHMVTNPGNETRERNLTCLATSSDQSLSTKVLITFCADKKEAVVTGSDGLIIAIVTVVSVLSALVVLAIVMLVKFRRNCRPHRNVQIKRDVRSPVEMDEALDLDVSGQPGQSEVTKSPEVKYEDRIAPQVANQYEERISSQDPHNYEYKLSRQVAHKYEDTTISPQLDEHECDDTTSSQEATPMLPDNDDEEDNLPPWADGWKVPRCDLIVDERVLGRGNFGEVRSGGVIKDGELRRAAIKMLKGHASPSERDDFMDELYTMTSIGHHVNVVSLLGACRYQEVLYVALEYLHRGDLRSYLRTARSQSDSDEDALSSDQLVKFALDVAKGMEHIAKAGVIHRDLAARNILLSEGLIAKVSDFGLSRGEDIYVQTSKRRVPVRWLAIESIRYKRYTTKSDVWSFGILMWEIATIGGTPYPTTKSESLARKLKGGYRMPKPSNCDDKSYDLMRKCWQEDPNNRPSFSELVSTLSDTDDSKIKHTYFLPDRLHYQNLSAIRPEFDDN
ncbi:fibroblast growth factor receptor 2-like [Patiria miniata]|uniref:receptor protein-tyrosine kinase n=1 Tax=Patiria miniata TaxID=46514 RepID=A0A914AD23_PATMI|nr:fibroblast growth factor receptor 2-like [Patiria miniata]